MTSSERRVQRVRKAFDPPGEARDDVEIVYELARRLGHDLGSPRAEDVWNELRSLSPMHAGMSYARLEELGGIQWPCPDEERSRRALPPRPALGRTSSRNARRSRPVEHDPPVDVLDADFPLRLTTGRRLESFNTGVQIGRLAVAAPRRRRRRSSSRPRTASATASPTAARVRVVSRRGAVEAPARYDTTLRPGLAFMNLHFPDEVATNVLTIDATDPKSGTAEFKATAIRLEPVCWISSCSTRSRPTPSARRSTRSSGPRREREPRRAPRPQQPPSAAPGAAGRAAARRLGDAGRARLRIAPPRRAAGGRVRRGDVLRAARARGAPAGGAPRLHRPLVPARRRRGARGSDRRRRASACASAPPRRCGRSRGRSRARNSSPPTSRRCRRARRPEAPAPHRGGRRSASRGPSSALSSARASSARSA